MSHETILLTTLIFSLSIISLGFSLCCFIHAEFLKKDLEVLKELVEDLSQHCLAARVAAEGLKNSTIIQRIIKEQVLVSPEEAEQAVEASDRLAEVLEEVSGTRPVRDRVEELKAKRRGDSNYSVKDLV